MQCATHLGGCLDGGAGEAEVGGNEIEPWNGVSEAAPQTCAWTSPDDPVSEAGSGSNLHMLAGGRINRGDVDGAGAIAGDEEFWRRGEDVVTGARASLKGERAVAVEGNVDNVPGVDARNFGEGIWVQAHDEACFVYYL